MRPEEAGGLAGRACLFGPRDEFSVPRGADPFLLRWVLHNWRDEDAIRILRNCRLVR